MSDILDKARQVAADTLAELGYRATADEVVKNQPIKEQPSHCVCSVLDALSAANLLAREPKAPTEKEKWNKAGELACRNTSGVEDCYDYGDWLLRTTYPDYAATENELADAKEKIAELQSDIKNAIERARTYEPDYPWKDDDTASIAIWAVGEGRLGTSAANNDLHDKIAELEAPLREEISELTAKLESICEAMACTPDDDPIHWGQVLHRTLHAANELRCENKQQAEEIEQLKADRQSAQSIYETASRKSKQLFGNVIAERDQLRIDNEQLRGELSNAYKVSEDRNRLRLLLAEAHGWIKSYRLGEGDSLQERIEDSIGIGQAVHRTSVPTGRSTEAKPLLADAILCFEDWKELSAQRQWELFQRKRKEEIRLRTIVAWCAWNTDWADQLQSSTQLSTEDDLVKAMCKAIACHLHNGSSKGDIK